MRSSSGTGDGAYLVYEREAQRCEGVRGRVVGTHLDMRHDAKGRPGEAHVLIATTEGIFRTPDLVNGRGRGGAARGYTPYGTGLPKGTITSFSGGAKGDVRRLYATVESSWSKANWSAASMRPRTTALPGKAACTGG